MLSIFVYNKLTRSLFCNKNITVGYPLTRDIFQRAKRTRCRVTLFLVKWSECNEYITICPRRNVHHMYRGASSNCIDSSCIVTTRHVLSPVCLALSSLTQCSCWTGHLACVMVSLSEHRRLTNTGVIIRGSTSCGWRRALRHRQRVDGTCDQYHWHCIDGTIEWQCVDHCWSGEWQLMWISMRRLTFVSFSILAPKAGSAQEWSYKVCWHRSTCACADEFVSRTLQHLQSLPDLIANSLYRFA